MNGPTERQIAYVEDLRKAFKLNRVLLDAQCVTMFGTHFYGITRAQCSDLLTEMEAWKDRGLLPTDLQRMAGQQDLPGL